MPKIKFCFFSLRSFCFKVFFKSSEKSITLIAIHTLDCPDDYGPARKGDTTCSPCTWNCRICQYGYCSVCNQNYMIGRVGNCLACPEGQYSNGRAKECQNTGCRRCSDLDLGQCISCLDGLYWDPVSKSCKASDDPYCNVCFGPGTGQCNICNTYAYSTPKNTCHLCGAAQSTWNGIRRSSVSECKRCEEENCLQCWSSAKGTCQACRPGYIMHGGFQCWPGRIPNCLAENSMFPDLCIKCSSGYILDPQKGRCIPCQDMNCATCDNMASLSCSSCEPGFYLKNDKSCGVCEDNDCSSCLGAGQNQCIACKQGFTLNEGTCVSCGIENCAACEMSQKCSACKNGYYLDSQSNQCKYCGDGSASPTGAIALSQCGACKSSADQICWTPSSLTAAVTCKPGYGITVSTINPSWTTCMECPSNCKSCDTTGSSITNCTTCHSGYFLNEQKQCSPCQDNNCDQCYAQGIDKCASCKPGFILQNGQCNAVCSDSNCAACSQPGPNACTSCLPGHHLTDNGQCEDCKVPGCNSCSSPGKCLSCSVSFYSNSNDGACQKCPDGKSSPPSSTSSLECYDCADDKCLKCNARNPGSCQVCADGYVVNPATKKCDKCYDPQCLTCMRSGQDMAQQCTACSLGYFPNGIACEPCADKDCTECFGIGQGKCSTCKNGYFKTRDNTCKACEDDGCTSCSAAATGKCSACVANYYLKDSRCIPCAQGRSSPPGSKSIEGCIPCDDQFCESCHGERGIGKCQKCSSGYYLTQSSTCKHCDDKACLACSGPGLRQCTTCAANYQRSNSGTCEPCPEGTLSKAGSFYESCGGGGCRACNPTNLDEFLNCLPGFYLKNTQCIACEEGKYPSDPKSGGTSPSYCRDCDILHCKTCSGPGTGPKICSSCKDGWILNEAGFCVPCQDQGCKACLWTGTRQCAVCEADYYLKDNECVPCGEGKSSAAGSTKPEDCQKTKENSSSSSSFVLVLGVAGVFLALVLAFLYKKTNIFGFGSKKVPSISNSPANAYGQLQEIEESGSKQKIELGSLN